MIGKLDDLKKVDFIEGCSLLINKPIDWTSFDVVNKIRFKLKYHLGVKKIKVGHAGTLDPLATGLLIICTGRFTKKLADFQGLDKTYTGEMVLGFSTPSYDAESEPNESFKTEHISNELIEKEKLAFLGDIDQVPPIYSAIKIKGRKAYELARRGKEVELKARSIHIFDFELEPIEDDRVRFEVRCSKGTYIRSLVHDFGIALKSGAYLSELRRTKIGDYDIQDAFELEEFTERVDALEEKEG